MYKAVPSHRGELDNFVRQFRKFALVPSLTTVFIYRDRAYDTLLSIAQKRAQAEQIRRFLLQDSVGKQKPGSELSFTLRRSERIKKSK